MSRELVHELEGRKERFSGSVIWGRGGPAPTILSEVFGHL